jgi:KDO2-lipid IV(A) lauroyltransferase
MGAAKLGFMMLPARALFRLARVKGMMTSLLSQTRRQVRAQLRHCFGETNSEAELRRIARRYFQFAEANAIVGFWPQLRSFNGSDACRIEGLEHLDAALERGKGAILLSFHLGYTRLIKPVLRARGYPVLLVGTARQRDRLTSAAGRRWPRRVARRHASRLEGLVRWRLLRLPMRIPDGDIEPGINIRPVLAALARNEVVCVLADGKRAGAQLSGRVLGIQTGISPGVFSIAAASEAVLLPAFVVDASERVGAALQLEISPPLVPAQGTLASHGFEQFIPVLERYVERYPYMLRWGTHRFERASPDDGT